MNSFFAFSKVCIALLLISGRTFAQPGKENFDRIWVQGAAINYTSEFSGLSTPLTAIIDTSLYFVFGNSNICDSSGDLLLASDGFNLYDKHLKLVDNGASMSYPRYAFFSNNLSLYPQTSIILPFANSKYRLITPSVSDDSCINNWMRTGSGAYFDLLLYDEIDMKLNGGAGSVTKRMISMLENVRLSKSQMMACRHGDGKSWWLLKQAADSNLVYRFLLTDEAIFGPYLQGFTGVASHIGNGDRDGQAAFSKDGTRYATTNRDYGRVFVADFDRCTGLLSNPKVYKVPPQITNNPSDPNELDSSTVGLCFSPSGRFLYVSGYYGIQQFDLFNPTAASAWTYLSGPDTTWSAFQQYSNLYLAPNGRIYIGNGNGFSGQMSVIDAPDQPGIAAGFCRKCLRFPGYFNYRDSMIYYWGVSTPPCMPNYRLGPTNPICYQTGISSPKQLLAFTLSPNPSWGQIKVTTSEPGHLSLFDVAGRCVFSVPVNKIGISTLINIQSLPGGFYQYRFTGKTGRIATGKFWNL